ncbi:MAG: HYC_CC_PP family protein [Bacteroidota bacterium]|uniref:HYC_CC_PP family protein n=1 Tax=Sediminibacterium sp. TaxID=1917865 RepID=UPI000BCEAD4B|nr:hypothetical protein [Sediminibacterium sp.]MCC7317457.1 hypothetical protein [Bacteroidales bacterium]OYZ55087.1 MAG: hypothetical protein B7Y11_03190 [Sphingobacteriia bacterium 24-36-13]OZA63044.1 MAG: hypothetical protein B7X68_11940 [Sphingobacteriia bacterium 39-36-14]PJE46017.1 MAG: hypothetical protein CUR34_11515 [Sediminibacterium sp.] [Sediminibacterium sp. FEMGT703S]HQS25451.1 hypothetical protein [Sediminibacterium sp.]
MKKIVVILLLLIYGSATMGATIHMHYCMNEFVGWSLWHGEKEKECGKCGMKEKKGGCCKDEHKQVKLKTEHQKSATAQYIQFLDVPALITPVADFSFKVTPTSLAFPVSNAPPKIPRERLYILHCVFLI